MFWWCVRSGLEVLPSLINRISLYPPVPQTPTSGIGCFFRNVCGRRLQARIKGLVAARVPILASRLPPRWKGFRQGHFCTGNAQIHNPGSNIKTTKTVYLAVCLCHWKQQSWYLRCFCSIKIKHRPKDRYLHVCFYECVENTGCCDVFLTRGLPSIVVNTSVFFTFITSSF